MWLDRFSNNPTPDSPPSQSRASFQQIRRPSQQGLAASLRPGPSPRASSLQLGKYNNSTTSLNSPRLLPNGSSLKQELVPPPDDTNTLAVLEGIVGKALSESAKSEGNGPEADSEIKPAEVVGDIDFGGLSLRAFAHGPDDIRQGGEDADTSAMGIVECEYV